MSPNSPDSGVGIAILAKAPVPSYAKTRLIPHLGEAGAAALQRWLLERTVRTALSAGLGSVTLWCAPDATHSAFVECRRLGRIALREQPPGDLGERMHLAVEASAAPGGTLVIGTDCPALTPGHLREAAVALSEHDAALVPAEDGGYVLIGLRRATRRVFEAVDWSTARVMAQTRARLDEAGLRCREFAPLWDVDRGSDLARLVECHPELAGLAMPGRAVA
jgi:rSAM/selenodomain-associated transferase 1